MFGRILLAGILTVSLCAAQGGGRKRGGGGGEGMGGGFVPIPTKFDSISEMLKLNKDQKKEFKAAMDEGQKEAAPLRDQIAKARLALGQSIQGAKGEEEIQKLSAGLGGLEAQMAEIEMRAFSKVHKSLDKEQIPASARLFHMMKGMFSSKNWNSIE